MATKLSTAQKAGSLGHSRIYNWEPPDFIAISPIHRSPTYKMSAPQCFPDSTNSSFLNFPRLSLSPTEFQTSMASRSQLPALETLKIELSRIQFSVDQLQRLIAQYEREINEKYMMDGVKENDCPVSIDSEPFCVAPADLMRS